MLCVHVGGVVHMQPVDNGSHDTVLLNKLCKPGKFFKLLTKFHCSFNSTIHKAMEKVNFCQGGYSDSKKLTI